MLIKKLVFGFKPFNGDVEETLKEYGEEFSKNLWKENLAHKDWVEKEFPTPDERNWDAHVQWCRKIFKDYEKYGQVISFNSDYLTFENDYKLDDESIFVKNAYPYYMEQEKKLDKNRVREKTYCNFIINYFKLNDCKLCFRTIALGNNKKQYSFFTFNF